MVSWPSQTKQKLKAECFWTLNQICQSSRRVDGFERKWYSLRRKDNESSVPVRLMTANYSIRKQGTEVDSDREESLCDHWLWKGFESVAWKGRFWKEGDLVWGIERYTRRRSIEASPQALFSSNDRSSGDWQMILSIEEILTSLITIYRRIERRIDHRLKHVLPASHYNMSPERSTKSASLHTKPRNRTPWAEPTKHSIEWSPLPS